MRKGLTQSKEACREKEPSKSLHGRGGKASLGPGKMTRGRTHAGKSKPL